MSQNTEDVKTVKASSGGWGGWGGWTAAGDDDANKRNPKTDNMEVITVVPDGGWGWVVCCSCLFGNITMGGIFMSYGILLPSLKENFHEGTVIISFIGSIMTGLSFGIGPIVASLTNRLGLRMVFMMGSIFSAISLLASTFSPNANWLLLTYGICGGLGLGLIMLPTNIGCNYYFDKKRALATGISKTGVSIGGFIYPPMIDYLLETYNWKIVVYVYSTIAFVSCFFGALIRPLELQEVKKGGNVADKDLDKDALNHVNTSRRLTLGKIEVPDISKFSKAANGTAQASTNLGTTRRSSIVQIQDFCEINQAPQRRKSLAQINGYMKENSEGPTEFIFAPKKRRGSKIFLPAMAKSDTFDDGSIFKKKETDSISSNEAQPNTKGSTLISRRKSVVQLTAFDDIKEKTTFRKRMIEFIDPSFWTDGAMIALLLSRYFGNVSMSVFYMFLPSILLEHNITLAQSSLMLTAVNVVNTFSRVAMGALMDHPKINCLLLNAATFVVGGIVVCIFPFSDDYTTLMILGGIIGLMMASYPVCFSIAVGQMVPKEKVASVAGKISFGMGLGSVTGPVIAGFIFDYTNNHAILLFYDAAAFLLTALCACAAGLIHMKRQKV